MVHNNPNFPPPPNPNRKPMGPPNPLTGNYPPPAPPAPKRNNPLAADQTDIDTIMIASVEGYFSREEVVFSKIFLAHIKRVIALAKNSVEIATILTASSSKPSPTDGITELPMQYNHNSSP